MANRGPRAKYVCFDCDEASASVMLVRRVVGTEPDAYELTTYVHRTGSGCHKGVDAHTIRFAECTH